MLMLPLKNISILTVVLTLVACASSHEFQAIPQDGAKKSQQFPRFSDMPVAQSEQFSAQASQELAEELTKDKQSRIAQANQPMQNSKNAQAHTHELRQEVEQTSQLIEGKQIETTPALSQP